MMKIVILALRRPYTFVCGAILILILGMFAIIRMPVDIFPGYRLARRDGRVDLHGDRSGANGAAHHHNIRAHLLESGR